MEQKELKETILLHIEHRDKIKDFLKGRTDLEESDVKKLNAKIEELEFLTSEFMKFVEPKKNTVLVSGTVMVLKTPITERYCKVGDIATLDLKNKQIRCSGAWFKFDERWIVQPCLLLTAQK